MFTSDLPDVPVGGTNVAATILDSCARHSRRLALLDDPTGESLTYAALAARAGRLSAALAERGLGDGDVVAIWAPNTVPWVGVALGAMASGCIVTGVGPMATDHELVSQLEASGARVLFTIPPLASRAVAAVRGTGVSEVVVIGRAVDGATSICDMIATEAPAPDPSQVRDTAIAALPFSSGTTGAAKGVQLSHAALVTMVRQLQPTIRPTETDVVLALAPFPHIMGFMLTMLVPLAAGATVVTTPRFDPERFLPSITERGVTFLVLPPPLGGLLTAHPAATPEALASVRLIAFGGAPLSAEREAAVAARFPHASVGQGWGMTELAVGATTPRFGAPTRPGSVGRLLPNTQLRVFDPVMCMDVGAGADGELLVRGPQVMTGYLNRPDETRATVDTDGWVHTGDLGHIDADGWVFVVDRLKELIKVKGFQVAPAELEAVLVSHPGIADAAVVRREVDAGEVPVAFVVPSDPSLEPAEVQRWVAERVSPYKRLHEVTLIETLPRTPSGKLLRRQLMVPQPA